MKNYLIFLLSFLVTSVLLVSCDQAYAIETGLMTWWHSPYIYKVNHVDNSELTPEYLACYADLQSKYPNVSEFGSTPYTYKVTGLWPNGWRGNYITYDPNNTGTVDTVEICIWSSTYIPPEKCVDEKISANLLCQENYGTSIDELMWDDETCTGPCEPMPCPPDSYEDCVQYCDGFVEDWQCTETPTGFDEDCNCMPLCAVNYIRDPVTYLCVPDPEKPPNPCDPPMELDNLGNCVDPDAPPYCPPGTHDGGDGWCYPDEENPPPCADNFYRPEGQDNCVPWDDENPPDPCPSGQIRNTEGFCYDPNDPDDPNKPCGAHEYRDQYGNCQPDPNDPDPDACPAGQHRDANGECVPDTIECPEGQHQDGNECKDDDDTCPDGYKADEFGTCIPTTCAEGTYWSNGECTPIVTTENEYTVLWQDFVTKAKTEAPLFSLLQPVHIPAGYSRMTIDFGETLGGIKEIDFSDYEVMWNVLRKILLLVGSLAAIRILVLKG